MGVDAALLGVLGLTPLSGGVQGSPKLAHRASLERKWGTPKRLKKDSPFPLRLMGSPEPKADCRSVAFCDMKSRSKIGML